jgi:simple sugar transport system ATP-binding protein
MSDIAKLSAEGISKRFGSLEALADVTFAVEQGAVACLLGDNGAGKSTLIKIISGVFAPDSGHLAIDDVGLEFRAPRDALAAGIATVYQDLALVPSMPVARNFFLGHEPKKGWGPFVRYDVKSANRIAHDELERVGVDIRDPSRPVSVLSGGQRQCLAIARAAYLGARFLILDEPTSALGVNQATIVLRYIRAARERGLGIVLITHNVHHAAAVGDSFTILNHGRSLGTFKRGELAVEEMTRMMGGRIDIEAS